MVIFCLEGVFLIWLEIDVFLGYCGIIKRFFVIDRGCLDVLLRYI